MNEKEYRITHDGVIQVMQTPKTTLQGPVATRVSKVVNGYRWIKSSQHFQIRWHYNTVLNIFERHQCRQEYELKKETIRIQARHLVKDCYHAKNTPI